MREFAARLRRFRREKGITRYRLGKLAGISTQAVSNLEQRGSDPKLSTLHKLARALGVGIDELAGAGVRSEAKPKRKPG